MHISPLCRQKVTVVSEFGRPPLFFVFWAPPKPSHIIITYNPPEVSINYIFTWSPPPC